MNESQSQPSILSRLCFADQLGASRWQDVGLLIVRIYAGVTMAGAGMDKIPVGDWFAGQVEGIGFPLPRLFAFLAAFSEYAGGGLLVLGLFTRPAAFFMAVTMGVASWTIHADVPFWGIHVARIYFWVYVCLTLTGGGKLSLDYLYSKKRLPGYALAAPVLLLTAIAGYQELFVAPQVKTVANLSLEDVDTISLAGSFNDWTLEETPMRLGEDGIWIATVEIKTPGPIEFKFAANDDWALNVGATGNAKSSFPLTGKAKTNLDGEPDNIKAYIPNAGNYEFTINLQDLTYSLKAAASVNFDSPSQAED